MSKSLTPDEIAELGSNGAIRLRMDCLQLAAETSSDKTAKAIVKEAKKFMDFLLAGTVEP